MTTADAQSSSQTLVRFVLPEPPERHPDEMTSYKFVHTIGNTMHVIKHLGQPETTIVGAELFIVAHRGYRPRRVPDLLIALDADPDLYDEQNGFIISDQGKPPDFVLEVASPSTAKIDTVDKRREYAELGIPEYWRFDHTGESHGARLAGDRLVGQRYEPIQLEDLSPVVVQGPSDVLNLTLRWDNGDLHWIDPATNRHIPTFDDEREGRLAEREGRLAAEAQVRALQDELRRLKD